MTWGLGILKKKIKKIGKVKISNLFTETVKTMIWIQLRGFVNHNNVNSFKQGNE